MQNIKCVVIGDDGVGKTCMLISYTTNAFPTDYIPTVFDNYSPGYNMHWPVQLGLWDTAGKEDYNDLRPLSYPNTDIMLIIYAMDDIHSFNNIETKWIPEIRQYAPKNCPFIIVGNKNDLRDKIYEYPFLYIGKKKKILTVYGFVHNYKSSNHCIPSDIIDLLLSYLPIRKQFVDFKSAEQLSRKYGAEKCMECSALTQNNLKSVFDEAIRYGLSKKHPKKKKHCSVM